MQSNKNSILESVTNTASGFILSLLIQWLVYHIFGFKRTLSINIYLIFIFTVTSFLRSYILRRIFTKHDRLR